VPAARAEAAKWWRRAAENGCADAMFALAECHFAGAGAERSAAEARKWLLRARRAGHDAGEVDEALAEADELEGEGAR
jgi:TPR repeat protein